jgi:hypothetical protein
MKLRGLPSQFLHSCIRKLLIYSQDRSYLESLFSCIACENSWLNHRSRDKGRELPPSRGWWQFPALYCAPAAEPRVHINDQHIISKLEIHKWKQLILVFSFFFGLRVNEILNKTFILYSHQPSICSAA